MFDKGNENTLSLYSSPPSSMTLRPVLVGQLELRLRGGGAVVSDTGDNVLTIVQDPQYRRLDIHSSIVNMDIVAKKFAHFNKVDERVAASLKQFREDLECLGKII